MKVSKIICLLFIFGGAAAIVVPVFVCGEGSVNVTISAIIEHREPFVETHSATVIETDKANLHGELISLGPEEEAELFFQYRDKENPFWYETPKETANEPTKFSVTLTGLAEGTTYEFRAGVEWDGGLKQNFGDILEFTTGEDPAPSPPSVRPRASVLFLTVVVFEGRAYPDAFLTILKDNEEVATFFTGPSGLFEKELTGIKPGTYTFGIRAEDTEGRKSPELSFTVSILEGMETKISGIFMPPTIQALPTEVERGGEINIFGQAFPESEIKVFVDPKVTVRETKADSRGKWTYKIDTFFLPEGEYTARARSFYGEDEFSPFSRVVNFWVLESVCWGADLNFDGWVNTIDFSILLYFWKHRRPDNICADINFDEIVNIIDFSIMMYEWTG